MVLKLLIWKNEEDILSAKKKAQYGTLCII